MAITLAPAASTQTWTWLPRAASISRGHRHREQRGAEHDDARRRQPRHGPAVAQGGVPGRDVERGGAPHDVRAEPDAVEPRARLVVAEREVDLVGRHPQRHGHEQQPVAARSPRRPEDQLDERDQQQQVHRRVGHVHRARAQRDGLVELRRRPGRSTARSRSRRRRSPCRAARRGSCARRARGAAARSRARSSGSRPGRARRRPRAAAARGRARPRRSRRRRRRAISQRNPAAKRYQGSRSAFGRSRAPAYMAHDGREPDQDVPDRLRIVRQERIDGHRGAAEDEEQLRGARDRARGLRRRSRKDGLG